MKGLLLNCYSLLWSFNMKIGGHLKKVEIAPRGIGKF